MVYLNQLLKLCRSLTLRVSTAIPLSASNRIWVVRKGAVDIFFIQMRKNIESTPRKHIFRAKTGDIIFGLPQIVNSDGYSLVAVGVPGAEVSECNFEHALSLANKLSQLDVFSSLLNEWIKNLFSGLKHYNVLPQKYVTLDFDETVTVTSDTKLRTHKNQCIWINADQSTLTINDNESYLKIPPGSYFPLVSSAWLAATGISNISTYSTQQLIEQNLLEFALQNFHELLLHCYFQDFKEQTEHDLERLRKKRILSKLHLVNAIANLKNILVFKSEKELLVVDKENPLYAACNTITKKLGIDLMDKPTCEKYARSGMVEDIARISNFSIRKVSLSTGWWKRGNGILLARRNGSYVVLLPRSTHRYDLFDPETGIVEVIDKENETSLASDAYMFYRPLPQQAISGKQLIKFASKNTLKDVLFLLLVGTCGGLLSLLIPIATGIIFDDVIPGAAYLVLIQVTLLLLVVVLCSAIFTFARNIAFLRIDGKIGSVLQTAIWNRLLNLPTSFFRKYTTGDLAQRAMSISTIRQQISSSYVYVILNVLFSTFNLLLLFYYSAAMALIAISLSLLLIAVFFVAGFLLFKYNQKIQIIRGKLSGIVNQLISGIIKLRISNTEERAFTIWANLFSKQQALNVKVKILNNFLDMLYGVFPILTALIIFMWFATLGAGKLSIGKFLAFNAAFINFQVAILQIGLIFPGILNILPLYQRIKPILQELPETTDKKILPGKLSGNIWFDSVHFRYSETGPEILKNVSFQVNPEEFVAIVGESGAGKSTIFRLLLGFETPKTGDIYYDNKNLASLNSSEIRQQMGVVLQDSKLMAGSIYDNISGTSNITNEEAYEIACLAGLKEDIDFMPMHMHTFIGVGGSALSEGQRQRLIIARALAKKPHILLFDEATSALDNKTQAIVSKTLEKLNVTRLVIAHRLSTIINADRIYVLHEGEIVQEGVYKDLIKEKGFFQDIAKRQLA